jgi:sigma-54 dependent transcriptional regulator, acetoin dehydrogenase operon transcriptional activator AcoR
MLRMNWPGRVLGDDNDGLVCIDADGLITALNRPAADMLDIPAGVEPGHCTHHFAVPMHALFDAARAQAAATEMPLWSGLRLQVLAQGDRPARSTARSAAGAHAVPLKDIETALIRKAVDDARGNVMDAARALGISRATVYRKLGAGRGKR